MWSSNLNPRVLQHGAPGKYNKKFYVIELFLSSYLIERHLFTNKRTYLSHVNRLHDVFPSNMSRYYSGISFEAYELFYSKESYCELMVINE